MPLGHWVEASICKSNLNALVHRAIGPWVSFHFLLIYHSPKAHAQLHMSRTFRWLIRSAWQAQLLRRAHFHWKNITWLKLVSMSPCTISEDAAFSSEYAQTIALTA